MVIAFFSDLAKSRLKFDDTKRSVDCWLYSSRWHPSFAISHPDSLT